MKFGLEQHIIDNLIAVFEENPKVDKALVFGSRAMGNYRPDSDIDIALKGQDLNTDAIIAMSVAFEEKGITHKIDLLNYHTIKEPDLKDHIDRVGIELYSRWKEVKLGDVITFQRGHDLTRTEMGEGKFPVAGSNGIIGYHNKFTTKGPGVTIGRSGNIGTPHFYENDFWAHNTVLYIKDFKVSEPKFIYYFLKTIDFSQFNAGSSVPTLNRNHIHELEFILPPIQEQTAIAAILSSLDDKIDLLHRQNKTLEQLAETLFRQWFVEEAEESWEDKSLTEIADYLNGLALQKFPPKIDYLPVIKIREMKQGISENTDKCSRDIPIQYIIQDGDVLFSWSGSLEVVLWTGGEGALNQHLFKVTSEVYPKWFYYLATKHHLAEFKVIAESKSTTMGHIQREHLKQAMISIPPKELFNQYNEKIAPMIDKLIDNNKQIRTLTQTRDALLPKLMSGEVRVNLN